MLVCKRKCICLHLRFPAGIALPQSQIESDAFSKALSLPISSDLFVRLRGCKAVAQKSRVDVSSSSAGLEPCKAEALQVQSEDQLCPDLSAVHLRSSLSGLLSLIQTDIPRLSQLRYQEAGPFLLLYFFLQLINKPSGLSCTPAWFLSAAISILWKLVLPFL